MKKGKIFKLAGIIFLTVAVIASVVGYYLYNLPKRDIQASKINYTTTSSALVNEYLANKAAANEKYLKDDGDSKILSIRGKVYAISTDQKKQRVILLKGAGDKAGVSCTFTEQTNAHVADITVGQDITVKGVIRAGAGFDEDLRIFEDVIVEQCDIIN
jgi:hypothetical protein